MKPPSNETEMDFIVTYFDGSNNKQLYQLAINHKNSSIKCYALDGLLIRYLKIVNNANKNKEILNKNNNNNYKEIETYLLSAIKVFQTTHSNDNVPFGEGLKTGA